MISPRAMIGVFLGLGFGVLGASVNGTIIDLVFHDTFVGFLAIGLSILGSILLVLSFCCIRKNSP